jgi:hypothetical protein
MARLKEWRRPAEPVMVRVNVPGGAPFFRLELSARKGGVPWNAVEQTAGRCRTRMLFPSGIRPPAPPKVERAAQNEPGLRAFQPRRLPLLHCLRAAQQVLRRCETPAQSLSVALVDPRCVAGRALEPLVMLAGSLRVFTPDLPAYRAVAAQLLERYGVTLILSDSEGCFAQSDVVIADDLSMFTGKERGLIFTMPGVPAPSGCRVCRPAGLPLPEEFAALCPPGIHPLHFAAALFELCGVREMERLQPQGYVFQQGAQEEPADAETLAAMIDAHKTVPLR